MNVDLDLTGRRALVTAGTKGVGAAVVDVLHDSGATVVSTARAIPADAHTGVHYIVADSLTNQGRAAGLSRRRKRAAWRVISRWGGRLG